MKVILFVGISSGSGASTAAANFAASLAQDVDSKVLLMDANYRSAKKQESDAPVGESAGRLDLAHLLDDPTPVCPVPGPSNLYILPRGKPTSMPLSLFQSDAFDDLLRKLREEFKYVVIDGPALQGFPESVVLSRKVDGVILVLESEKTRTRTAQAAKEQIEGAGGKLLGVVLNKRKYYIPHWLYQYL
jgi:capsular exopolysaccharide synthesis family protein